VLARVVLGAEPCPVLGGEVVDGERGFRQLVFDLLAPGPVPSLDRAFGFGVTRAGVDEVNAEVGADIAELL